MAEEQKDEKQQVKSEEEQKEGQDKSTAYEQKALDKTGRDWSKRKTFKPEGKV
jgi:hypothetical protein